jgi:hypothetical protein
MCSQQALQEREHLTSINLERQIKILMLWDRDKASKRNQVATANDINHHRIVIK